LFNVRFLEGCRMISNSFPLRVILFLFSLSLLPFLLSAAEPAPSRSITVEECLARAVSQRPELKAAPIKTEAARHRAKQAGHYLNPKFQTEVEDFSGDKDQRDFKAAQTTLSFVQELELGQKRKHRVAAAEAETAASKAEEAVQRMEIVFETRQAACAVLVAQEKIHLAEELLTITREIEATIFAKEQAGKVTALETERAHTETVRAALELQERQAEQREAVHELALCWGETEPTFDLVAGSLDIPVQELPALDGLLSKAANHPALQVANSELQILDAQVKVENAARIPNLEVAAGVRRFEDSDGYAVVAGIGIELPLFNTNRDAVKAAQSDAEVARLKTLAARIKNEGALRRLYVRLKALAEKDAALRTTVLPSASRALALIREAHEQGKANYLDVLEARREVAAARLGLIETAKEYHTCRMALEERAGIVTPESK
jgi:cobalt-zinc-cadmium efflux system outer membrane protein